MQVEETEPWRASPPVLEPRSAEGAGAGRSSRGGSCITLFGWSHSASQDGVTDFYMALGAGAGLWRQPCPGQWGPLGAGKPSGDRARVRCPPSWAVGMRVRVVWGSCSRGMGKGLPPLPVFCERAGLLQLHVLLLGLDCAVGGGWVVLGAPGVRAAPGLRARHVPLASVSKSWQQNHFQTLPTVPWGTESGAQRPAPGVGVGGQLEGERAWAPRTAGWGSPGLALRGAAGPVGRKAVLHGKDGPVHSQLSRWPVPLASPRSRGVSPSGGAANPGGALGATGRRCGCAGARACGAPLTAGCVVPAHPWAYK